MVNIHSESLRRKAVIIMLVFFFVLLIVGQFLFFHHQAITVRQNKYDEIRAIAQIKSNETERWREERFSDADYFSRSPELKSVISRVAKGENDRSIRNDFERIFSRMKRNHGYQDIIVANNKAGILYSFDNVHSNLDTSTRSIVLSVLKNRKILLNDFYYSFNSNKVQLDIAAPVDLNDGNIAALVFTIDPDVLLYPLIQAWPTPSKSSEILLIRREDDSVIFLSHLRHINNIPLKMKFPVSEINMPSVKAGFGYTGNFEGRDYRGVKIMSFIDPVPGTPWFIVAKIDKKEVFADLWSRLILMSFIIVLFFLFIVASIAYLYNRRIKGELEKRVEERTKQLKKINKELESFAYTVSHDLRAPLRAIVGFTGILSKEYTKVVDDEGGRIIGIIGQNAQKMGTLIDDLLAFSRLGRAKVILSRISMKELVRSVFEELTLTGTQHKINFKLEDLHPANCDQAMIKQVWINLISNALKFTSRLENPAIYIHSREEEHSIIYCIEDNGAGFDMKYYDKLFEAFQRLHSETEFEGNGVGLAIVQEVVQRHCGEVWAEGKIDQGATFCFSLPK